MISCDSEVSAVGTYYTHSFNRMPQVHAPRLAASRTQGAVSFKVLDIFTMIPWKTCFRMKLWAALPGIQFQAMHV